MAIILCNKQTTQMLKHSKLTVESEPNTINSNMAMFWATKTMLRKLHCP